ncbi:MAG: serine hydroxymethyltransferase [Patescibacteria group bacterium]|mgnify:CR=1 FL=1
MLKDKVLSKLIQQEIERQQKTINLIPSENYVSKEILEILGSPLTNKYSEGYPGKRYYAGNKYYDQIETLAQQRMKKFFKLGSSWHVNVQPYSGSPANMEIYFALMDPGDMMMGMSLTVGGHLSHGHKVNFSGKVYKSVQYGVDSQTGLIDYDVIEKMAFEHHPRVIVSGHSAYPREIDFKCIGNIARKVGAFHVADISHIAGLVATGLHQSPFEHADIVMTTTHKTLRGPRGAVIFCKEEYKERIDRAVFPGMQGGPHNNVIAAIAEMAFEDLTAGFKKYQKQILKNSSSLAGALKKNGFKLLTDGTDNHLMLIDLKTVDLDGQTAQDLLEKAGITVNRNAILGDSSPFNPTGIRLGTPAITTRGMKEKEMKKIAEWFQRILIVKEDPEKIRKEVEEACKNFPLNY